VVRNHEGGTCGGGGTLSAEAEPQGLAGVDSGRDVDEGEPGGAPTSQEGDPPRRIPREEGQNHSDPGGTGALNGSEGHGGRCGDVLRNVDGAESAEDLEGQPVTAKAQEGAGKYPRPATRATRGTRITIGNEGDSPAGLEGHVNLTRALLLREKTQNLC
jgi:hypothetical protein